MESPVEEAYAKVWSFVHVLLSESNVEEAVESVIVQDLLAERSYPVPLMVMVVAFEAGVNPKSDDEAAVLTFPLEPTYASP